MGKQSNSIIHHLENNDETKITERVDIANRLVQKISKNSSSNNCTKFQKYQVTAEKEHLVLKQTTQKTTMCRLRLENYVML